MLTRSVDKLERRETASEATTGKKNNRPGKTYRLRGNFQGRVLKMEKEERNIDEVETLKAEKEKYKRKFEELKIMEEARSIVSSLPKNFNKERILAAIEDRLEIFTLDDVESAVTKMGKPLNSWINEKSELYGFKTPQERGGSADKKADTKDFISEIASMLK